MHDYLVDKGGAERVLEIFHEIFPEAPIFTSIYDPDTTFPSFRTMDVRPSFLQHFIASKKRYRWLLPFYPMAFESFDFTGYDLVLSSTTSFAKGVITGPDTLHICFCFTPTRFLWRTEDYLRHASFRRKWRPLMTPVLHHLRLWDFAAAQRVDHFIAQSCVVARRIRKWYGRESIIIHSPIDVTRFQIDNQVEDYYLVVSRLEPYKRIDLPIEVFNRIGLPLLIVGDGSDKHRLRKLAKPNIRFLGFVPEEQLVRIYARCRALIFPGEEDFGLTPLEANASGRPVIAYAGGGALETVIEGVTGVFFREATAAALAEAVKNITFNAFDPVAMRAHAMKFDKEIFREKIRSFLSEKLGLTLSLEAKKKSAV